MSSLVILVHNIRSLYNVGAIFRTADAIGVDKIFLSGYSGIPPKKEITKTAIGAEEYVPWEKRENPIELIQELKENGYRIVALEQTSNSIDYREYKPEFPLCLVLGHEVLGVDKKILDLCDDVIEIPMYGKKASLNVSVAFGICVYKLLEKVR